MDRDERQPLPGEAMSKILDDGRYYTIAHNDLVKFLTEHKVPAACPVCGNPQAGLGAPADGGALEPRIHRNKEESLQATPPAMFPMATLTCTNCGNVRFFALARVMAWLNERNEKGGESNGGA